MVKDPEIHCRRLGHGVRLSYCVRESVDLPCRLVYQCWAGRLPIRDHLLTLYSEAQLAPIEAPPEPVSKLATLVDLINQARNSQR